MTILEVPGHDIVGVRAANPGPFTRTGTNSWVVGRGPAWLVDPGPALDEHLAALWDQIARRGGLGGIALTHDHADHSEAVPAMRGRYAGVPVAGARGDVDVLLGMEPGSGRSRRSRFRVTPRTISYSPWARPR